MTWQWMFYTFGFLGLFWVLLWTVMYREARGPSEEEFVEPPKVSSYLVTAVIISSFHYNLLVNMEYNFITNCFNTLAWHSFCATEFGKF